MLFFTAEKLFDGKKFVPNKTICTTDTGTIVDVIDGIPNEHVKKIDGFISPGFINAHCHLELSYLHHKIPEHTGLVDFLLWIYKNRSATPQEIIQQCIQDAETQMLTNGIVAVGDISNTLDTLECKAKNKMRYHTFVECIAIDETQAIPRFQQSKTIAENFLQLHGTSIVPHAPYTVCKGLFNEIHNYTPNQIVSIHNQECEAENELYMYGTGKFLELYQAVGIDRNTIHAKHKKSLAYYYELLQRSNTKILVHNTFTSKEEFETYSNANTYWCLCPNANLYIENTIPDISLLTACTNNIVLGTDSLASNNTLSIWDELCTIQKHAPSITLETMLQWATSNGAKALQMEHTLGSIEKGKTPGLLQIVNNTVQRLV